MWQEAPSETAVHEFAARELRACRRLNGIQNSGQVQWGFQALGTREAGNRVYVGASKALAPDFVVIGLCVVVDCWFIIQLALGLWT